MVSILTLSVIYRVFDMFTSKLLFLSASPIKEYPEKTTDLSQVTDKTLSHNVVSREWDSNSQL
jgi:hypothetical protein